RPLHHPTAPDRGAPAVGPLRRRRQEGGAPPRVGAGPGRNAGHRGSAVMALGDTYGRPLRNLRISVTDRCNLRCAYCMPEEDYVWLPRAEILHVGEVAAPVDTVMELGVDEIPLAGGARRPPPALGRLRRC